MFPDGKLFAFTILDDTDDSTTENVEPVYRLLRELGFRTTKTVWPLDCPEGSTHYFAAETLQNPRYRQFTEGLLRDGFELASHGATMESSERERTLRALSFYRQELGISPNIHVNHGQNRENVYWGAARYHTFPLRLAARLFERWRGDLRFEGHVAASPYFWGDLCRQHFRFVRSFTFNRLNVANIPPGRPYHIASTPYVNYWFTTTDAPDVEAFARVVTRKGIDALARHGGFSIVSTHLGKGFVRNGQVDSRVEAMLRHVSTLPGWFVPVSTLLDHLLRDAAPDAISRWDLFRLEYRHVFDRIWSRYSKGQR